MTSAGLLPWSMRIIGKDKKILINFMIRCTNLKYFN
jgi:hypothetical protein